MKIIIVVGLILIFVALTVMDKAERDKDFKERNAWYDEKNTLFVDVTYLENGASTVERFKFDLMGVSNIDFYEDKKIVSARFQTGFEPKEMEKK